MHAGAWRSLRVEATWGGGSSDTPFEFASNRLICNLLAKHDPSLEVEKIFIPRSSISKYITSVLHQLLCSVSNCFEFRDDYSCGQGGYSRVYKGYLHGTPVAIKCLTLESPDQEYLFRLEVGIMSLIRHPNICALMGASIEKDSYCLIMEYIPKTLESVIDALDLDFTSLLNYAIDTSRGMLWLHKQ